MGRIFPDLTINTSRFRLKFQEQVFVFCSFLKTHQALTFSNSTIETIKKGAEYFEFNYKDIEVLPIISRASACFLQFFAMIASIKFFQLHLWEH